MIDERTDTPGSAGAGGLVDRAREAMGSAYAPYSRFRVGAALEADDGRVFVGCNVENASYPVALCAERNALGQAVTAGARRFTRIAVVSSGGRPASPCGMCRQALAEFGLDLEVVSWSPGEQRSWRLSELIPDSFRPEDVRGVFGDGEAT